jgi:hypothetical protein
MIRSRASRRADIQGLADKVRELSEDMGGSKDDPIVGAKSYYKTEAMDPAMTECALLRVVVKKQGKIIDERFLDEDGRVSLTFRAWVKSLPKGGRWQLETPLITFASCGDITAGPHSPSEFESR